ncbi:NADH dehydrogenase [ubiquinone] 1 beta subcomplex subunit 3 [Rhodnius prolixus]|uniref:NADH dehydrogenase [ubiquinone] 1 beta subcomplex subunit 3 n=1 Tax=Rhodnius prolixus TaxID=13249 RepID=T1IA59_RHOPR
MGGGHHDLGERMKIPDYRIYKVEDVPELVQTRDLLAKRGLKDPWLRNEVWRYNVKEWGTTRERVIRFFFPGFKWGVAAFIATIAIEKALSVFQNKKGGSGHH